MRLGAKGFLIVAALVLPPDPGRCEDVTPVAACELLAAPAKYDHKLIQVSGTVSYGFENFSLSADDCTEGSLTGIWLEYGGSKGSQALYCCGVAAEKKRSDALVVEGVTTSLQDDATFRRFDAIVHKGKFTRFKATLVGRYFSGQKMDLPSGPRWGGYGHFGMFSLLVIERVTSLEKP